MSKVVDERIVSMQFDNKNFERNIQGTMSTLDKFKEKLRFDGATKGLENVSNAAKKVDMNPISKGVETVVAKFSALDVAAVTVFSRMTNAAVNAGKRIASSLIIEPKSDGFKEYELMLNSIQTTMAGTGKTAKEVEDELKKLDEYADKTVYSTADMLTNLPKFTNAGVELEKATTAMIGIANATALAGGDASKASIAFYNLGQAIGTGYLTRMDYNSINNAGIATMEWKNQMVEAAIAQGTLTKVGEDAYKAGNKTLTLQQLFIDGLQEQWATTDVMMKVFGDYGDETTTIGKKSYAAAQNIKTFTQMMESLKATAGTGWKDTWQIIFGDLDGATKLWTGVSNAISGILTSMANFRNAVLESALGRGFSKLGERISGVLNPVSKTADKISDVVDAVKDYSKIVDQIIGGEWGNGKKRWEDLAAAGYDWAHAQNLVNEKLGDSTRHATKYSEAQKAVSNEQKKAAGSQTELTDAEAKRLAQMVEMTDAELEAIGCTKDQIDALRELKKEANKTGYSVEEFVKNIDKINGRSLLLDSFKNIGESIAKIFTSIKDAWVEVFDVTPDSLGQKLYDLIAGLHKLTSNLVMSDETADKLKRTFKGLFAILDIVATLVGGPLKLVFTVIGHILKAFGLGTLNVTSNIGDAIVAFRDWLKSVLDWNKVFEKIKPAIDKAIDAIKAIGKTIKDWFVDKFNKALPTLNEFIDKIKNWGSNLKKEFDEIAPNLLSGLKNGLIKGAKGVWDTICDIGRKMLTFIKNILGIHSPSTEMEDIGINMMLGAAKGLSEGAKEALNAIAEIFRAIVAFFPQLKIFNAFAYLVPVIIRLGSDTASGFVKGLSDGAKRIFSTVSEIFKAVIEKVKDLLGIHSPSTVFLAIGKFLIAGLIIGILGSKTGLFDALGKVVNWIKEKFGDLKEYLGNIQWPEIKMEYILGAGALVGLVVFTKKLLDISDKLADGIKGLGKIGDSVKKIVDRIDEGFKPVQQKKTWEKIADSLLKLSLAIAILAGSVYLLTRIEDPTKMWIAVGAIGTLAVIVIALAGLCSLMDKNGKDLGKISWLLTSISVSLLIMASAIKKLEFLNETNIGYILGGLAGMIVGLAVILATMGLLVKGKTAQNIDKAGITILKISAALLLMTFVIKQVGTLDQGMLIQGGLAVVAFSSIIVGLIAATRFAGKKIDKAGPTILKIAAAILLMAFTAKILGSMKPEALIQGGLAVVAFSSIIVGLIAATKFASGNDVQKIGGTILAVSAAMMLMSVTALICSMMSWTGFAKGLVMITAFSSIIVGLIAATRFAGEKELKGVARTLLAASMAIAIMSICAVILSLVSVEGLIKGVAAVSILGVLMAIMIASTRNAGEAHQNIKMMALAIGVMAAAVVVLSLINPKKLAGSTAAIGILMGMFALMTKAAGQAQKAVGVILAMTVAVAAMAGLIYWLAQLPIEQTIGSAIALGTLMLALSASMLILQIAGKNITGAVTGVAALTALMIPLYAVVGALAIMGCIPNAIASAQVLLVLMGGLTLVILALTIAGALIYPALLGVVALTALMVPILALVGILAIMENIPNAMANSDLILNLMGGLTEMLIKLAIVGPLAIVGVTAMYALVTLFGVVGLMATAAAALMKIPGFVEFVETGMGLLKKLALGIGEIISAFMVGVSSGLPEIGENLSDFMNNLTDFITGANAITADLIAKVGILSAAIILLTGAEVVQAVASFLTGGSSFAALGADLSAFMIGAMPFITGLNAVKPESLTAVKALADAILTLTAANVLDGLTSWFTGGASLADFGAELAAFGPHMAAYAAAVAGIDGPTVEASANAAKALAEMAKNLPNSGGVVGWFTGENDMDEFGTQLESFGGAIKRYGVAVTGIAVDAINTSVSAAKSLIEVAKLIPNTGGCVAFFAGDNDMATFGSQLWNFGWALKNYSLAVTGLAVDAITTSVSAAKSLIEVAELIPNTGGCVAFFAGDNDMATFGTHIAAFGASLLSYSNAVLGINVEAIKLSVTAAQELFKLPTEGGFWDIINNKKINLETFQTKMQSLGTGLRLYSESVFGFNGQAVSASINSAKQLVQLVKNIGNVNSKGIDSFVNSINKLGKVSIDKFVSAFTSSTSKLRGIGSNVIKAVASGAQSAQGNLKSVVNSTVASMTNAFANRQEAFKSIGAKLMTALTSGFSSKKESVYNAMKAVAASGVTGARDKYQNFYNAGSYAVSGFVQGIKDNKYKATDAGSALGKAAYKAAKAAIDSNSPSKKFMELGKFSDEGLAKGLSYYAFLATRASAQLGKDIVYSMQDELDIHSPAKVVKDEVGKYVVEGLAEGIKKDMSAEEAAEQKAKNIVDAFKTEMEKHDLNMTTADLDYELWEQQNPSASMSDKLAEQEKYVNKRISSQQEKLALAYGEYQVTLEQFGEESEHTQKAYNKWVEEQIGLHDEEKKLSELRTEYVEERIDTAMETADLEYDLWEIQNEGATVAEKTAKSAELAYKRIASQQERVNNSQNEYKQAFETFGADATETQQAYNKWVQDQIDLNNETKTLLELRAKSIKDANDMAQTTMDGVDLDYQLWEQKNPEATDAAKASKKNELAWDKMKDQAAIVGRNLAAFEDAKERYGEGSKEAKEAENEWKRSQIDLNDMTSGIGDYYDEALRTQQNAHRQYVDLLQENRDKFLAAGISQADIEKWAQKQTGYDPEVLNKLLTTTAEDAATEAANIVNDTFTECMNDKTKILGADSGVKAGAEYGQNVVAGVTSTAPNLLSAAQVLGATCSEAYSGQTSNGVELGKQFVEQFAQGVTNSISTASQATITMITSAYQAAIDFINNSENEGYSITPRITPILDLSNIQNGAAQVNGMFAANTAALADVNVRLTNDSITELSEMTEQMRLSNEANHAEIVNTIKTLKGDFNALVTAINGMYVRLDGNAVVGELIGKIDSGLGQIETYKGRGN